MKKYKTNLKITLETVIRRMSALIISAVLLFNLTACSVSDKDGSSVQKETDSAENDTGTTANKNETNIENIINGSDIKYPEIPESGDELDKYIEDNKIEEAEWENIRDFSWETSANIISNTGQNENYSPVSLYFALSLLAAGANGETAEELAKLLKADNKGDLMVQSAKLSNWMYLLGIGTGTSKLDIANSLWLQKDIHFKDGYKNFAETSLRSAMFYVDFANPAVGELMSKWIEKHTGGLFKPEMTVNPNTLMSIINTVYFYDEWVNGFNESLTEEGEFYISNDKDVTGLKREFMKQKLIGGFYRGDGFIRSYLNLKNGSDMVFILPDKGEDIDNLISDKDKLKAAFTEGEYKSSFINWEIPKFSFESQYELEDMIQKLGAKNVFSANADFSDMADDKITVDSIIQESHIGIDEKGVEAAAYTVIKLETASFAEETADMILNRPFAYAIMTSGDIPLFVGVYKGSEDIVVCGE